MSHLRCLNEPTLLLLTRSSVGAHLLALGLQHSAKLVTFKPATFYACDITCACTAATSLPQARSSLTHPELYDAMLLPFMRLTRN